MKKWTMPLLLCITVAAPLLAGCHSTGADNFNNKPRAEQIKEMQGDPAVAAEMAKKYGHQGPPPSATPAATKP